MKRTWQMLIAALSESSTQLFCTTHSEELITNTLSAFSKCPEDLALFRIEHTRSGTLNAVRIDYESLKYQKTEILTGSEHVT